MTLPAHGRPGHAARGTVSQQTGSPRRRETRGSAFPADRARAGGETRRRTGSTSLNRPRRPALSIPTTINGGMRPTVTSARTVSSTRHSIGLRTDVVASNRFCPSLRYSTGYRRFRFSAAPYPSGTSTRSVRTLSKTRLRTLCSRNSPTTLCCDACGERAGASCTRPGVTSAAVQAMLARIRKAVDRTYPLPNSSR